MRSDQLLKLILDSTVIIAFFREIDGKDIPLLMNEKGYELIIPEIILKEVIKEPSRSELLRVIEQGCFSVLSNSDKQEDLSFQKRYPGLGRGELAVLRTGLSFKARRIEAICLLDDRAARNTADSLGIAKMGTIGLIRKIGNEGIISQNRMKELLLALGNSSFRMNRKLCKP